MVVPIIIAVKNEEAHLERTLRSLPENAEPIVVHNGSTDRTPDIARSFESEGVTVLESEPGKMFAIQEGLRYLGNRATDPFITLDGDSRPLVPTLWVGSMLRARASLPHDKDAIVVGPYVYASGSDIFANTLRTVSSGLRQYRTSGDAAAGGFCGRNMLIDLSKNSLDEVMSLGYIWPGEDHAIAEAAMNSGGETMKSIHPFAAVLTDAERMPGIVQRMRMRRNEAVGIALDSYLGDNIPGTTPYQNWAGMDTSHVLEARAVNQ